MAKIGKRLKSANEAVTSDKLYTLTQAVALVKQNAKAKFDETIDVAVNLGVVVRQSDQNIRGMLSLPHGTGKSVRVAVMARGLKADEATKAGADIVGSDDLAESILAGKFDFDRLIATPDLMPLVGRLGKVLGPKGLMPNPKLGTVTMDVTKAVTEAKAGAIEYRAEKAGIVQNGVAKASMSEEMILANIKALVEALLRAKPASSKGVYLQKISISSTMGPGVKVDVSEFGSAGTKVS
ncbi:MAG: ribosomal protein [Alphaproteobacteria bacterium]|nr:ribosomal protein [Alphaproteobacteria bacterium]